jgi:hypothetical protein
MVTATGRHAVSAIVRRVRTRLPICSHPAAWKTVNVRISIARVEDALHSATLRPSAASRRPPSRTRRLGDHPAFDRGSHVRETRARHSGTPVALRTPSDAASPSRSGSCRAASRFRGRSAKRRGRFHPQRPPHTGSRALDLDSSPTMRASRLRARTPTCCSDTHSRFGAGHGPDRPSMDRA